MARTFSNILIYEDAAARSRKFLPLTYTRSVAELRSGAYTGIERIKAHFTDVRIFLHSRPELKNAIIGRYALPVNEVPTGRTLFVNAREALNFDPKSAQIVFDSLPSVIAESLRSGESFEAPETVRTDAPNSLWGIIHSNAATFKSDLILWKYHHHTVEGPVFPNSAIINPETLFVHPTARIDSGVVLDCTEGPIIIEDGVRIMPHVTITGPVFIGKNSTIKVSAKIYGGTSIGPISKVGGEIENSIIQGCSNKQHDGYLGHSFLGEWVNLGAGTNTSDLKNDYSPVRVTIEGETFDTNSLFVGLLMGDHSKSAIGTQFNTGTAAGVSCNIFGAGFPPKWIPNFSWGGASGFETYRFNKAIEVARAVMIRRQSTLNAEEEALLKHLFHSDTSRSSL